MRVALVLFVTSALAQSPAPSPTFDAASVKPAAPPEGGRYFMGSRGGPGTQDPGRVTYTNSSLTLLLTFAYDVKSYQISGPAWLESENFDIVATLPKGATKEQMRVMLQNLLAERFHLVLHHDSKELQGYELTVAKNGPKLKESAPADPAEAAPPASGPPGPPKIDANGFPILAGPGLFTIMRAGPKGVAAHMAAKAQPLSKLVAAIGDNLRRPVVDHTNLIGTYDFNLEFAPDMANMGGPMPPPPAGAPSNGPAPAPEESGPDILTAVREQLGLKLEAKKLPVDILVVDKIDRVPTEN